MRLGTLHTGKLPHKPAIDELTYMDIQELRMSRVCIWSIDGWLIRLRSLLTVIDSNIVPDMACKASTIDWGNIRMRFFISLTPTPNLIPQFLQMRGHPSRSTTTHFANYRKRVFFFLYPLPVCPYNHTLAYFLHLQVAAAAPSSAQTYLNSFHQVQRWTYVYTCAQLNQNVKTNLETHHDRVYHTNIIWPCHACYCLMVSIAFITERDI